MRFLPIVDREVRVAARRRRAHGLRLLTALAVVNAVLFSLTGGMLVSAMSRDHTKAILGSLIFVLAVSGLVPGLTVLIFKGFLGRNISSFPLAALFSPIYTGLLASDASA